MTLRLPTTPTKTSFRPIFFGRSSASFKTTRSWSTRKSSLRICLGPSKRSALFETPWSFIESCAAANCRSRLFLYVKCQTSHVECQMNLSNDQMTKLPNDELICHPVVWSVGRLTTTFDIRHWTFDI